MEIKARTFSISSYHCRICQWTSFYIRPESEEDCLPCHHEDWMYDHPYRGPILKAMHAEPPELWKRIIVSGKLCSGRIVEEVRKTFFELPLTGMQPIQQYCHDSFYIQMGPYKNPVTRHFCSGETCSDMYHATQLKNLVQPMPGCAEGRGILNDGFLRYGEQAHDGLKGVNYYSVNPETCTAGDGWCLLKLTVSHGRRLKGGARCKQCIPGPFREPCLYASIVSLMVLVSDVPSLVYMA